MGANIANKAIERLYRKQSEEVFALGFQRDAANIPSHILGSEKPLSGRTHSKTKSNAINSEMP